MLPLPAYSALVGAIYDCALHPERWEQVLATIETHVGAIASYLMVHDIDADAGELALLVERNVDLPMRRLYSEHYLRLNPLLPYLASARDGEVYATRDLVTQSSYLQSPFYREWASKQDWFDYAGVTLIRDSHASAAIGFTRAGEGNVFDDASLSLLRLLAPHLTRTARIVQMLQADRTHRESLAGIINATNFGALILGSDAHVLFANAMAEALLARGDGVACRGRSLVAGRATPALHAALGAAARRDSASYAGTTLHVERSEERRPLILHVIPVSPESSGMLATAPTAVAIVFILDPEKGVAVAVEVFGTVNRLTNTERAILRRLALGDHPIEIAASLGIATATVRTHLHRLYEKTGTRGQAELVSLFLRSAPPLREREGGGP